MGFKYTKASGKLLLQTMESSGVYEKNGKVYGIRVVVMDADTILLHLD